METFKSATTSSSNSSSPHSRLASDSIQTAINELQACSKATNTLKTTTKSTGTSTQSSSSSSLLSPHSQSRSKTISEIDSTLSSLNCAAADQFPFSDQHRARPHPSSVSSTSKSNEHLHDSLGQFRQHHHNSLNHSTSLGQLYAPTSLSPMHPMNWANSSALRNPYSTYGAHRSAQKAANAAKDAKDSNNPRKKTYEDKMDKQRLEHILFSGAEGPLDQVKHPLSECIIGFLFAFLCTNG